MGLKDKRGFMKLDYGEHCLILMLLGTNQDQYLMRLQNLVQLEAKEKYKEKTDYHLSKAYTGITATTEYQLNEFVPITKSTGGFTLDCTKTLGYQRTEGLSLYLKENKLFISVYQDHYLFQVPYTQKMLDAWSVEKAALSLKELNQEIRDTVNIFYQLSM